MTQTDTVISGPEHRSSPTLAERCFTVVLLLMSTAAFACLNTVPGKLPDEDPGVVGKVIATSIYLITLLLLTRHCRGFLRTIVRERFLFALVGLTILSAGWSDNPSLSFRRGLALLGTSLFGLYFSSRYEMKEQIRLLARMCGISVVCSFIFGLLGLGQAVEPAEGWFGIYDHKNALGRMMVLSVLVFWFFAKTNPKHRWLARMGIPLALALIILSRSVTAIVSLSILALLWAVLKAFNSSLRRGLAFSCLVAAAAAVLIRWIASNLTTVAESLGRSVTLTGRLTMWILGVAMALKRPWLGYGYNAFWQGMSGASSRMWAALNWAAPHAHSGFLDLWLDLGLLGLTVFTVGFLICVHRAFYLLRNSLPESPWPLMFLGFLLLYNLTESTLLVRNTIFWVLYTGTVFTVSAASVSTTASGRGTLPNPRVLSSAS